MKLFTSILIGLLYILNLGCSSSQALSGLYKTTKGQEIAFSGTNIEFLSNQRFKLEQWSDDISSNKKGMGTYRIENKQLILNFKAYESLPASTESKFMIPPSANRNIGVLSILDTKGKPLVGVTIILMDAAEKIVASGVTNKKGYCQIYWSPPHIAQKLAISYIGFNDMEIDIEYNISFKYEVKMSPVFQYYSAGEKLVFQIKRKKDKFILSDDRRTRVFYKKD